MTNSEHNDLEKLLKDNLSDQTAPVPGFVWDRIEEELFPPKKRRGFFWLFFAGMGLLITSAAVYLTAFDHAGKQAKPQLAKVAENKEAPTTVSKPGNQSGLVAHTGKQALHGSTTEKQNIGNKNIGRKTGSEQSTASKTTRSGSSGTGSSGRSALTTGKSPGRAKGGGSKAVVSTSNDGAKTSSGSAHGNNSISGQATSTPENPTSTNHSTEEPGKVENAGKSIPPDSTLAQKEADSAKVEASIPSDMDEPDTLRQQSPKKFAININGGTSLYDMAVFKDYFTSGQLSNRTFASSGFEIGAGFSYQVTPKFGIYTNVAFNRKSTMFNYDLAITESDYFHHLLLGELLPIENIIDNGVGNCFLAKDVKADYQIDSWLFSIGATYQLLQWKKFTLGADLRLSANLNSALTVDELTVLKIKSYTAERFNYLKTGAGLNLDYRFNDRISLGIAPMFHFQFNPDQQSFYKGTVKELVLPLSFKFHF